MARDLQLIGISRPEQLIGRSPLEMYRDLCRITETVQDPCVIDVFMSVTSFMSGGEPRPGGILPQNANGCLLREAAVNVGRGGWHDYQREQKE